MTEHPFTRADRHLTGICGLLVGALSLVAIPLYFVYSGPPPAGNVLLRDLLTVVTFAAFLIFTSGVRRMLGDRAGLAGDITAASGLVYAAMTMVAASLEAGVALQYPDGSQDPTASIGAVFMLWIGALGLTVLRTRPAKTDGRGGPAGYAPQQLLERTQP